MVSGHTLPDNVWPVAKSCLKLLADTDRRFVTHLPNILLCVDCHWSNKGDQTESQCKIRMLNSFVEANILAAEDVVSAVQLLDDCEKC